MMLDVISIGGDLWYNNNGMCIMYSGDGLWSMCIV